MISSRRPPTFIPTRPSSQPGMTAPAPSWKGPNAVPGVSFHDASEDLAVAVELADVVDLDLVTRLGGGAGADDQIGLDELLGRRRLGERDSSAPWRADPRWVCSRWSQSRWASRGWRRRGWRRRGGRRTGKAEARGGDDARCLAGAATGRQADYHRYAARAVMPAFKFIAVRSVASVVRMRVAVNRRCARDTSGRSTS